MTQQNTSSAALSLQQNERVFKLLGNRCTTLATGVVQVFLADSTSPDRWSKKLCGVACFVKDNAKRSYFIRVFDLKGGNVVWEQETYNQFKYNCPRPFFHTFEADESRAGLNFCNDNDASEFERVIKGKLAQRSEARSRRRGQNAAVAATGLRPELSREPNVSGTTGNVSPMDQAGHSSTPTTSTTPAQATSKQSKKKSKSTNKKGGAKLTKSMISQPTEFRHLSHLGWDPNEGFDLEKMEPEVKDLLDAVGLTPSELSDKDTASFVNNFIEENGGLEAIKKRRSMAPTDNRGKTEREGRRPLPSPPEMPPKQHTDSITTTDQHQGLPAVRGSSSPRQTRPVRSDPGTSHSAKIRGAPPPPLPSRVKKPTPPPPPPLPPVPGNSASAPRQGMNTIGVNNVAADVPGTTLKPSPRKNAPDPVDGHQALMAQLNVNNLRNLKTMEQTATERAMPEEEPDDLESALKRAMKKRYDKIKDDDADDNDFENFDDDEWD